MRNLLACLLFVSLSCPALNANDGNSLPDAFRVQMQKMEGSWAFTGKDGDRQFSGKETIRIVNGGTALLQEGYFDLDDGEKEHYVILSGWDGDKQKLLVRGFTSSGVTFQGEWGSVKGNALIGSAQGKPARFGVSEQTMRYEEDNGKWISKFERVRESK